MNEDALNLETTEPSVPLSLLGEVLAAIRKEQGVTQQELSARLGLQQGAVARMEQENYRTVNFERLVSVAQALGIRVTIKAHRRDDVNAADSE